MSQPRRPNTEEVDHLLLNARLRDELEPFLDESVCLVDVRTMPTPVENEFLASMLAWERAPVLPISQWFAQELVVPSPDTLSDEALHQVLWDTIHRLCEARIVLDFTDHLSDRELYRVIYRDILPSPEKKIDLPRNYLHWACLDPDEDPDTWLRYYATESQRREWSAETGEAPPASQRPPHPRKMPTRAQ
ncbi:MAG: hypothetical protein KY475_22320 [Planctomycetes bacterium]|nr:hypothetical protein [Planctomycetota bacterium]